MSGARAMVAHLLEPTLPAEMAQVAAYYARTPGAASAGPDAFNATVPRIREDLDPRLATLLGLDPHQIPDVDALAQLLAGRRADGEPVEGRKQREAMPSLAAETGLATDRLPTAEEVARVVAGRHAGTSEPLPAERAAGLRTRLLRLLGADDAAPDAGVVAAVAQGCRADGGPLRPTAFLDGLTATRAPVRFVDLCFSADKSLSLAWAFAETEAERALLHAVHRAAVAATMRTIEGTLGRARRGKGGRGGYEPGHMAWLGFDHFTSRPTTEIATRDPETGEAYTHLATVRVAGSPQLHTHVCALSHVLTDSGHVGTVDLAQLHGRVHEWGALYQSHIATGLRRIGIDTRLDPATGAACVVAVPERVRAAFSRRTTQGEAAARAYAQDQGLDWNSLDAARRIGLLKNGVQGDRRAAKTDDVGDLDAWRREAESLGWRPVAWSNLDTPIPLPDRAERMEIARVAAAPILAEAFKGEAVVDESAARLAAARGLVAAGIEDAAEIDDVARALLAGGIEEDGVHTPVIVREVRGPRGALAVRLTTGCHIDRETRLVALARAAAGDRSAALTIQEVDAGAAGAGLNLTGEHGQAQGKAMREIGTGGRVGVLVGAAGAGKSTLLSGLVRAWEAQGRKVYGTATAWRQAQALSDAGIPPERCIALAALLARARAGTLRLDVDAVILVDEVSLVSVKDSLATLELREAVGCTLVAIGDPRQGRSVEAGGVVGLLGRALGGEVAEVTSTVRQRTVEERELAGLARAGRAGDVLDVLRDQNRARLAPGTLSETAEAVADLWQERAAAIGEDAVLVVAPTREDCRAVSLAIRQRKRAMGRLGPDIAVLDAVDQAGDLYALPVAVGDRIRLYGRTHARGAGRGQLGVNGSVVEVLAVEEAGLVLRASSGREGLVPWTALRDRETGGRIRLGPGDCLTLSAAQGATAEESILAMPRGSEGVGAAAFYVGLSRHRSTSWLVLGEGGERRAVAAQRGIGDARPIRAADLWSNAAANFSRRPGSEGALDLLDRAAAVRHAAEDGFRRGLARMERRAVQGLTPTILPAQGRRRRIAQALEPLIIKLAARAQALTRIAALAADLGRTLSDASPPRARMRRTRTRTPAPRP
ncbi:MobF family relaxase [Methylobacterium goesingense]|uniref:Conjugative relaxase-like TrwC/TraI family protein n=1 Tax=Methylobacterium goesingense TaxID=243690 RepID=A0ABV2LBU4_9HYPH|nr:MobF family relaxase [Methylobacterium goesingense]